MPRALTLVLLCAVVVVGCDRPEPRPDAAAARSATAASPAAPALAKPAPAWLRDHYRNLADCAADWGHAGRCLPADAAAVAAGTVFYGPYYARSYREEAQYAARKEAFDNGYLTELREQPSDTSVGRSEAQRAG